MKKTVFILILSVMLCSCSSTVHFNSVSEANLKLRNQSGIIILNTGKKYTGRQIRFSQDSASFINQMNDSLMQIKTHEIESIYVRHRTGGALEGFLIGGAIGMTGGLIAGVSAWGSGTTAQGRTLIASLASGAFGGLAGLMLGTIKGHEYTFKVPQDSTKPDSNGR